MNSQERSPRKARKREEAIAALLTHGTIEAAAGAVGLSEPTLRRWLRDDRPFATAYRAARRAVVEVAIGHLQQAAQEAVETLRKNLKAEKPSDQIRAAGIILERAVQAIELMDLAERVEELETAFADKSNPPRSTDVSRRITLAAVPAATVPAHRGDPAAHAGPVPACPPGDVTH